MITTAPNRSMVSPTVPLTEGRVLIVDDEPIIRQVLCQWVTGMGYDCAEAGDGIEALHLLQAADYVLLITDIRMPRLNGIDLLRQAQVIDPSLAVIIVSAIGDQQVAISAIQEGATGYLFKPFNQKDIVVNVTNALAHRQLTLLHEAHERELEAEVRQRTAEIHRREEEITLHLVAAAEYRDEETGSHIRRMALYAAAIANALGWSSDMVEWLRLAAPMHDVGKIGVPDQILLKTGTLTPEEFTIMQRHTLIGANILERSDIPLMHMAHDVALCHHERWDGTGYPHKQAGDAIPESARIVAIADVYDALLTDRVYRPAFSEPEAFTMMVASKGHFDPRIFTCMCDIHDDLRAIRRRVV